MSTVILHGFHRSTYVSIAKLVLEAKGVDVLYDDRDERAGAKFGTMDLIGLPWQLIAGPKGLAQGLVELKCRHTGDKQELSVEAALAKLTA